MTFWRGGGAKAIGPAVWAHRLWGIRWAIAAALIIAILLIWSGLSPLLGVLGFVIFAIALLASRTAPAESTDWSQLQTIIDALPDPVVALNSAGIVVAFNEKTRTIAPALRAQLPVSVTLGAPVFVEAVERAISTGKAQRAEFSETMRADDSTTCMSFPSRFPLARRARPLSCCSRSTISPRIAV